MICMHNIIAHTYQTYTGYNACAWYALYIPSIQYHHAHIYTVSIQAY